MLNDYKATKYIYPRRKYVDAFLFVLEIKYYL